METESKRWQALAQELEPEIERAVQSRDWPRAVDLQVRAYSAKDNARAARRVEIDAFNTSLNEAADHLQHLEDKSWDMPFFA